MKTVTRPEWESFQYANNVQHEEIEINEGMTTSLVRIVRDNRVLAQAFYQRGIKPIYQISETL